MCIYVYLLIAIIKRISCGGLVKTFGKDCVPLITLLEAEFRDVGRMEG